MNKAQAKRRAYGQHFLVDDKLCQDIANRTLDLAKKSGSDLVIEIGPGSGALTKHLLPLCQSQNLSLLIIERDREIAERWQKETHTAPYVKKVIQSDFLDLKPEDWQLGKRITVVSNLPYSAGTAIFTELARYRSLIPYMVLMFQKEVSDRLEAPPSTPDRGSLSVWTQNFWHVERICDVKPAAFRPPPKVMSSVQIFSARTEPRIPGTEIPQNEDQFEKLLKIAFAHRRKMLRSSIPAGSAWKSALEKSGVDITLRPEALDWPEWMAWWNALQSQGSFSAKGR
jgi:16S rRNA (adenine1518-N6/adenine1519-N6)-dimethyltransferase